MTMTTTPTNPQNGLTAKRFANLILDMGTFLLASGAHSGRVYSNIKRMADTWHFEIDMQPTFKGLLVCVKNLDNPNDTYTSFRESPQHSVHMQIITHISHLSWQVVEKKLSIDETEIAYAQIKSIPNYSPNIVSLAVGISCAGLCIFSSGDFLNAAVALLAAYIGSMTRFGIAKMKFNPMIPIIIAAFITTLITGASKLLYIGIYPQAAMATAVLYLVPGVPLLNCAIDVIEGYLSSAINRALFAGFILLCIAVGMTLSITLMGIENF